jgi:hypothetical protein
VTLARVCPNEDEEGKRQGAREYAFDRSEPGNMGLLNFESNWGRLQPVELFSVSLAGSGAAAGALGHESGENDCGRLPNPLLTAAGSLLYKHIG